MSHCSKDYPQHHIMRTVTYKDDNINCCVDVVLTSKNYTIAHDSRFGLGNVLVC